MMMTTILLLFDEQAFDAEHVSMQQPTTKLAHIFFRSHYVLIFMCSSKTLYTCNKYMRCYLNKLNTAEWHNSTV